MAEISTHPASGKESVQSSLKGRRQVLLFLFLFSMITYLDRVNISIASTSIEREYGLNRLELGTVFSAFVIGYMLFQIPGGWLGDKFGHKKLLNVALIWWSVFTGMTALAGEPFLVSSVGILVAFWIMRFLVGCGEAAGYPCANGIIGDWFRLEDRGLAIGVMWAGMGVGSAATPPFVAWIMLHYGWRSAFHISAIIGIMMAICFDVGMPERAVGGTRTKLVTRPVCGPSLDTLPTALKTPWRLILRNPQVWFLTTSIFFFGYITYVYFFWFNPYLVDIRGISLLRSSIFSAMPFVAMALTAPFGGWLSDRLMRQAGKAAARRRVAMGGLVSAALLIPLGARIENQYAAVACFAMGAGSVYIAISSYFATALDIFPQFGATVSGVMNAGASFGGIVAPILTPWVAKRYGWTSALTLAGLFSLIAAILWKFIGNADVAKGGWHSVRTLRNDAESTSNVRAPHATGDGNSNF